ncbi:hypothetical protein ACFFKD_22805, partial [Ralstonia solanacearum]
NGVHARLKHRLRSSEMAVYDGLKYADKELSALLAGNRLVPIVHQTTYPELRNVSPLLASRTGLDTAEDSMSVVATKIAELVAIWA